MKTEKRVQHYVDVFICDECGTEYLREIQALACEHRHRTNTCAHRSWRYEAQVDGSGNPCVWRVCCECGKEQEMGLSDCESKTLEQVWALVAKAIARALEEGE